MFDKNAARLERAKSIASIENWYNKTIVLAEQLDELIPEDIILNISAAENWGFITITLDQSIQWIEENICGPIHREFNCDWERGADGQNSIRIHTCIDDVIVRVYTCAEGNCRIIAANKPVSWQSVEYTIDCGDENV